MNADLQKLLQPAVNNWKQRLERLSKKTDIESYSGQLLRVADLVIFLVNSKALSGKPLSILQLKKFAESLSSEILAKQRIRIGVEKLTLLQYFQRLNALILKETKEEAAPKDPKTKQFKADPSFTQLYASMQKIQDKNALADALTQNLGVIEEDQIHAVPIYPLLVTDDTSRECLEFLSTWITELRVFSWEKLFKDTSWWTKLGVGKFIQDQFIAPLEEELKTKKTFKLKDVTLQGSLEAECKSTQAKIMKLNEVMADKSGQQFADLVREKLGEETDKYKSAIAHYDLRNKSMTTFKQNSAALKQLATQADSQITDLNKLNMFSKELNAKLKPILKSVVSLETFRSNTLDNIFANIRFNNALAGLKENLHHLSKGVDALLITKLTGPNSDLSAFITTLLTSLKLLLTIELAIWTDFNLFKQLLLTAQNLLCVVKDFPKYATETEKSVIEIFGLFLSNIEKELQKLDIQTEVKIQRIKTITPQQQMLQAEFLAQKDQKTTTSYLQTKLNAVDHESISTTKELQELQRRKVYLETQLAELPSHLQVKDQVPPEVLQRFYDGLNKFAQNDSETKASPVATGRLLDSLGGAGQGVPTVGDEPSSANEPQPHTVAPKDTTAHSAASSSAPTPPASTSSPAPQ